MRPIALAFVLSALPALLGCGSDGRRSEPKIADPNVKQVEPKTSAGAGQPAGPKGKAD